MPALRRINSLLLAIAYPDSFYHRVLDPAVSGLFSRVILWHDDDSAGTEPAVVGGIVCRLEPSPFAANGTPPVTAAAGKSVYGLPQQQAAAPAPGGEQAIYIQSLALLSPYRSQGLAAAALEEIIASAARAAPALNVRAIYAHVWTENTDGLAWYTARRFVRSDPPIAGYYFKLRPDTAWIVRRDISPLAALTSPTAMPTPTSSSLSSAPPPRPSVTAAAANLPPMSARPPAPPSTPSAMMPPAGASSSGPSSSPSQPASPPVAPVQNYQTMRPDTEWNDLPQDMLIRPSASRTSLAVPGAGSEAASSGPPSSASSRSSSTVRKKRDRAYPTAAFGS